MLPDGNGISIPGFTAGVPQTFSEKFKYNKGSVTQGSYNFWTHPINGNLVAFVQAPASHEVLQSVAIPAKWPTAVGNVASGLNHVDLYPNPARTHTNLVFSLDEAASVSINVVDALGKVVYTKSEKMNSGKQSLIIATDNFAAGIYNVSIATEKGVETQRLTVAK